MTSVVAKLGSIIIPPQNYFFDFCQFSHSLMLLTRPHLTSPDQIEVTAGQGKVSSLRKALGYERGPKTVHVGTILVGAIWPNFHFGLKLHSSFAALHFMVKF